MSTQSINLTDLIQNAAIGAPVAVLNGSGKPANPSSGVSLAGLLAAGIPGEWIELQLSVGKRLVELPGLWHDFSKQKIANSVTKPAEPTTPKVQHERVYIPSKAPAGETPEQELARLRSENDALKAKKAAGKLSLRVSEKGAISVYGIGRFPVTLYAGQMHRLLAAKDDIEYFMEDNLSALAVKE